MTADSDRQNGASAGLRDDLYAFSTMIEVGST